MRRIAFLGAALLLLNVAGCATLVFEDADGSAFGEGSRFGMAIANPVSSPARGTKKCTITQIWSGYKMRKAGAASPHSEKHSSHFMAHVFKDGSVGLAVSASTYPGSKVYFRLGGKRYTGDARHYVKMNRAALDALKSDQVVQFSWKDWPYGSEENDEDVLTGFSAAYDKCAAFLKS